MTVAVENGLEQVAAFLHRSGYRVVAAGNYHGPIDALVYRDLHMPNTLESSNYPQSNVTMSDITSGVLMISAYGKTPEQIHAILQTRVYSPLF